MTFEEKMNRISEITDLYLCRYGRTQIGIFHLPTTDSNPDWFQIFTNTLMVTLRRKNIMPYSFWIRDVQANRFILILWGSGYFRNNLNDIARIVERAWSFRAPDPAVTLGSFSLSTESPAEDRLRFTRTVEEVIQSSASTGLWHQRSFGGSQIR